MVSKARKAAQKRADGQKQLVRTALVNVLTTSRCWHRRRDAPGTVHAVWFELNRMGAAIDGVPLALTHVDVATALTKSKLQVSYVEQAKK